MQRNTWIVALSCVVLGACVLDEGTEGTRAALTPVHTETLGDIGIALAPGTGIVQGGVGLVGDPSVVQPGTLSINVPGAVQQVIVYWEAQNHTSADDDDIVIDGVPITGTLTGGPTLFFGGAWSATYGADITGLDLVSSGANSLSVGGLDSTRCIGDVCYANGVGMLVIYDDGSGLKDLSIRDGNDCAFTGFDPPLDTTVPQTFTFSASDLARTATLNILATSVAQNRPNVIEVTVGSDVTRYVDLMADSEGAELDALSLDVGVPAGETSVTVQLLSERDPSSEISSGRTPASLTWLAAGFAIAPPVEEGGPCRVTGGGGATFDGNRYTSGGQAGARTAMGPSPSGEWTHHQQSGPAGSFVFHAGTASAPEGTGIAWIRCSDPGYCDPARPAPAKQIDFAGIGSFRNLRSASPMLATDGDGVSLHWFEVNIDDLGEPGRRGPGGDTEGCPADGFGRNGLPGDELAMCGCPDFYRIRIHSGPDAMDPVIYEVAKYIEGGNFQIHPPTGYDR